MCVIVCVFVIVFVISERQWVVGVRSFQKIYDLIGLTDNVMIYSGFPLVEIFVADGRTDSERSLWT